MKLIAIIQRKKKTSNKMTKKFIHIIVVNTLYKLMRTSQNENHGYKRSYFCVKNTKANPSIEKWCYW